MVVDLVYYEKKVGNIEGFHVYSNEVQIYFKMVFKNNILLIRKENIVDLDVIGVENYQINDFIINLKMDCKENVVRGDDNEKNKRIDFDVDFQVNYVKKGKQIVFIHVNDMGLVIYMKKN